MLSDKLRVNMHDTIVAQASAVGTAGVAVIRISGPAVPEIIKNLGLELKPRYAQFAALLGLDGNVIDHGLWLYFAAPKSFTGEAVLEFQGHGNQWVIAAAIARFCELGCRLAEPGEFSKRAFLNNKIDLVQAEAIADLVAANSAMAAKMALASLSGQFSKQIRALVEAVIKCRVELEAAVDFPEEDFEQALSQQIAGHLQAVTADLQVILAAAERGSVLQSGLDVALIGPPNAGKSSLFNALLGQPEAIVTAKAGTTRDVLQQQCRLGALTITLQDTAGLRSATDVVEAEGIARAFARIEQAQLVLLVLDERHITLGHAGFLAEHGLSMTEKIVPIWNKVDLIAEADSLVGLKLSAKQGVGVAKLMQELELSLQAFVGDEGAVLARTRHLTAIRAALTAAEAALLAMQRADWELSAEDCRVVQRELSSITGEFSNEDLLGRIFASFCIGK